MATNRALSNAPYSVTLTKDGVLHTTAVYDCYMAFETYTHSLEYVLPEYDVIWMD